MVIVFWGFCLFFLFFSGGYKAVLSHPLGNDSAQSLSQGYWPARRQLQQLAANLSRKLQHEPLAESSGGDEA